MFGLVKKIIDNIVLGETMDGNPTLSSLKSVQNFIDVTWWKMTPKPEEGLKEFNIYDCIIIALCGSFKSNGGRIIQQEIKIETIIYLV